MMALYNSCLIVIKDKKKYDIERGVFLNGTGSEDTNFKNIEERFQVNHQISISNSQKDKVPSFMK